ncbi:uncharacterized protein UTRI_10042 [Ustilago trichophora]|uniref:Uncharacterized protein n=1 Tax=Ustilago trichophora TaxID=86804 RepID=A0A5C3DQV1_9BASI|nr:uncharacterized protein UTRI_10042 [Ustilago trichophora]
MPQDNQCRLVGVIKEHLDKDLYISDNLKTIFSPSQPNGEKRRNKAADRLIEDLVDTLGEVSLKESCSHPPLPFPTATDQLQCNLIWSSNVNDTDALNAACNGKQLLERIGELTKQDNHVIESLTQSFDDQRELPSEELAHYLWYLIALIFQRDNTPDPVNPSKSLSPTQVRKDFRAAFGGNLLKLLQHFITRVNAFINDGHNYDVVYAKVLPILQSSGTGKTKLAVQLSAYQAGMLICTRNRNNSLPTSFPPFDEKVHTYFRDTLDCKWNSKWLPKAKLTIQYKRLAAWVGAYFNLLADCIKQLKEHRGCFDSQGQSLHSKVDACWQTVVYYLACRIHSGTDFIQNYSFQGLSESQLPYEKPRFCPESVLHPKAQTPAASNANISFGSDNSSSSSQKSKKSTAFSISILEEDPRFRTTLLHKITRNANRILQACEEEPPKDEAAEEVAEEDEDKDTYEVEPKSKDENKDTCEDMGTANCDALTQATSTSAPTEPKERDQKRNEPAHVASGAAQDYIIPSLEKLEDTLPRNLGRQGKFFFFLAIDEVAYFTELLPVLRRLWRESKPGCTWLILVDTESSIAHLAGDGVVKASLRLGDEEGKVIVPPFTCLPFDVHFVHRLENEELQQQLQTGSLKFCHLINMLRWLGRPLWGTTLYTQTPSIGKDCYRPHLKNILMKLFYGRLDSTQFWPAEGDTRSFDIIMAAVTSRKFLQQQVSSYLRIVSDVNRTNSYVTATPSEPAVLLAVASEFRRKTLDAVADCILRWSDAVHTLAQAQRSVGLMLGEEGEECVRLLVTIAADLVAADRVQRACTQEKLAANSIGLFRAQYNPICLRDWLQMLFNTESKAGWYKVHPDHPPQPGRDILEWASDYYLNFTHFVELGLTVKPEQADPALLVEYWLRQAAIYGTVNQHAWDLLIPIYRSTSSAPSWSDYFDPSQLSYVAIQVKNCYTAVTDRFGPSCWYPETVPSSANPTDGEGAASSQGQWPRPLDDCLEIFFDLRGVSGVCLRDFTETRPRYEPKKGGATSNNLGDTNQEAPSLSPPEDKLDVVMEEAASPPENAAQGRLRPNNYLSLVVSGTSASVLHVITNFDEPVRKELRLLFAVDDDVLEQNWKRVIKQGTTGGAGITKDFEKGARVMHGLGPNHLLPGGPGATRRPRGATAIPGLYRKGKKRAHPDGGDGLGELFFGQGSGTGEMEE